MHVAFLRKKKNNSKMCHLDLTLTSPEELSKRGGRFFRGRLSLCLPGPSGPPGSPRHRATVTALTGLSPKCLLPLGWLLSTPLHPSQREHRVTSKGSTCQPTLFSAEGRGERATWRSFAALIQKKGKRGSKAEWRQMLSPDPLVCSAELLQRWWLLGAPRLGEPGPPPPRREQGLRWAAGP